MVWEKIKRIVIGVLTDKKKRFLYFTELGLYNKMPDEEYLKKRYKYVTGTDLNLDNPKSFNEKIQWLKIHDRNPIFTKMVDKYEAKEYVKSVMGEEYIIPTLGVWNHFDDINFDELPNQFVIKCTHDSGGLVIVRDKNKLNKKKAREKIEKSLRRRYFYKSREWPYKNVQPRIIAETYMFDDSQKSGLIDYKFYCLNGEPRYLYVSKGLENHETASISFLNMDWTFADFKRSDYKPLDKLPEKPKCYGQMIQMARRLSQNIPFLRVDLYEVNGKIYFSELTFSPCSGMMPFDPPEADLYLGQLLELPEFNN